tara:strand:- start:58 stop:933 length:876 start_codon:yes stop_codon:yes gene_type:complete
VTNNSLFPRKSDIFSKSLVDARDTLSRPSLDTLFQVSFSFGNWQTWLDGLKVSSSGSNRSFGSDFMQKMSLLCTEAELPGTEFQRTLVTGHHQGIAEEFPNLRTYPPLNLVFYVDDQHVILEVFETWMTYINPISTNKRRLNAYGRFNYPEDYKEIIHITKFEKDTFVDIQDQKSSSFEGLKGSNKPKRSPQSKFTSYEFVNVWPTNLSSMRVAYGDSNVLRCSVEFAYDRFFTDFNYTSTNQFVGDVAGIPVNYKKNRNDIPEYEKPQKRYDLDTDAPNQWWDFRDVFPN